MIKMNDLVGVILRHVGQMSGATLVSFGLITEDQTGLVVGLIMSLGALGWGICQSKGIKFCKDNGQKFKDKE